MDKINWKVRFKNPQFWIAIGVAFFSNLFIMSGVEFATLTTWAALGGVVVAGLSNPFIFVNVAIFVYLASVDFTTEGIRDSNQALKYLTPKKHTQK